MSHAGSEKVGEDEVQVALLGAGSHAGPPSEVPGLLRTLCLYPLTLVPHLGFRGAGQGLQRTHGMMLTCCSTRPQTG